MTAAVLPLFGFAARHQCQWPAGCLTEIPADRALCLFHARPTLPQRNYREDRYSHVLGHLREQDQPLLEWLILPITLDEVAHRLGPGWTRRMVELALGHVRADMGLSRTGNPFNLDRMALLRVVSGFDRCFCGA